MLDDRTSLHLIGLLLFSFTELCDFDLRDQNKWKGEILSASIHAYQLNSLSHSKATVIAPKVFCCEIQIVDSQLPYAFFSFNTPSCIQHPFATLQFLIFSWKSRSLYSIKEAYFQLFSSSAMCKYEDSDKVWFKALTLNLHLKTDLKKAYPKVVWVFFFHREQEGSSIPCCGIHKI